MLSEVHEDKARLGLWVAPNSQGQVGLNILLPAAVGGGAVVLSFPRLCGQRVGSRGNPTPLAHSGTEDLVLGRGFPSFRRHAAVSTA